MGRILKNLTGKNLLFFLADLATTHILESLDSWTQLRLHSKFQEKYIESFFIPSL